MRQLATNPWDALHDKYPVGMTVEGRVRNLTDFGAFIEIEDGIDGLVHVSNLSWTKRVKHPSEVLKKGDRVKGDGAGDRARQAAFVAGSEAAAARCLGDFLRRRITSAM
jgi:exoribonuclease R